MARRIRFGWLIAVALLAAAPAGAQYPGQNIPPTRVPLNTEEPPLADKKTPGELPEKVKQSIIGAAPVTPRGVTPIVPAATVSPDPPTPVVSIHVSAPASASAAGDVEYKIVAENKSQAAAHRVRVTFPISDDVQVQRWEPLDGKKEPGLLVWDLGTLKPGERRNLSVNVLPKKEGLESLEATARVQFEHGQKVRTVLHRPQIAIRKVSNRHALENEPIACKLIVENTGAVEVSNLQIDEITEEKEGLSFDEKGSFHKQWKIAALRPKETQERAYTMIGLKAGAFSSKIEARAERGVKAEQDWKITVGPSPLAVKITGPKQVYLNYPARYDVEVNYSATAPLDNVVVAVGLQKGMKIVRATPGAKNFENRLQWAVPKLGAKETRTFSVWAQAAAAGTVPTFAEVLWHGPKQHAETSTEFLGAASLHLDIRESNDPVRVGDKVRYTLTVTNRGTAAATDVKLVASFPTTQFAVDDSGTDGTPSKTMPGTQMIGPLTVPPKGSVTKTVTLKATGAGKAIFHVEMESPEHLPGGNVTREEPTTITD